MSTINTFFLIFILLTARISPGNCQSPYVLKSPQEYILSGTAAGFSVTGFLFSQSKHKLTIDEIANLKSESINAFDRTAVKYYSKSAARTSDVLMFSSLAIPFALLLDKSIRDHSGQSGVLYLETMAIASVGINLSKGLIRRPRPYVYNPSVTDSEKQKRDATNSFFSGHTTISAASTFFAAKVFSDSNSNSKWKPAVWIGAAVIPLATGYYRYRAGKHFPTDVLIAMCYGAMTGIIIPQLHRR